MSETLLHSPLGPTTVHLCIDMQCLLAPEGPWPTPWLAVALERQLLLVQHSAASTIFTRFIPPRSANEMPGTWRRYYDKWRRLTREFIDPNLLELVNPLRSFTPPAGIVDKTRYSAFPQSSLHATLARRRADTLVVSGAETDVCVLATVLDAVDLGYRVVVASDAVCSSSDECHDALMTLYHRRFSEQIETAETEAILENWRIAG